MNWTHAEHFNPIVIQPRADVVHLKRLGAFCQSTGERRRRRARFSTANYEVVIMLAQFMISIEIEKGAFEEKRHP